MQGHFELACEQRGAKIARFTCLRLHLSHINMLAITNTTRWHLRLEGGSTTGENG